MNMRKFSRIFHFNPNNPEDAVLLDILDGLVEQHGGKVHALRWMLRQADNPTVRLDDESIQRIVQEIERRGVTVKTDPFEQAQDAMHETQDAVIISASLAKKWG